MARACVLQHISCEPPGIFADILRRHRIGMHVVELDEGGELPDWRDLDLIVAMGGPMGVYDEADHPWLAGEKRWIASAVRSGVPYLGVCLGAQLLAASLGGVVRAGDAPEVGVLPVALTADGMADPVLAPLGAEFPALQWHGDTFGIPAGAIHLGRSSAYPIQAFRYGEAAYAVQFHVEVTGRMLAQWRDVPAYAASAQAALGSSGFEAIARAFENAAESMAESAERMFSGWLYGAGLAAPPGAVTAG